MNMNSFVVFLLTIFCVVSTTASITCWNGVDGAKGDLASTDSQVKCSNCNYCINGWVSQLANSTIGIQLWDCGCKNASSIAINTLVDCSGSGEISRDIIYKGTTYHGSLKCCNRDLCKSGSQLLFPLLSLLVAYSLIH